MAYRGATGTGVGRQRSQSGPRLASRRRLLTGRLLTDIGCLTSDPAFGGTQFTQYRLFRCLKSDVSRLPSVESGPSSAESLSVEVLTSDDGQLPWLESDPFGVLRWRSARRRMTARAVPLAARRQSPLPSPHSYPAHTASSPLSCADVICLITI